MIRRPPRSTRTDTLVPYTALCRSQALDLGQREQAVGGGLALDHAAVLARGHDVVRPAQQAWRRSAHLHMITADRREIVHRVEGRDLVGADERHIERSEEHTSELQSLMRISYAVFCLKKKKEKQHTLK